MAKWIEAEPQRATDCETAFQNGGPRVYIYDEGWQSRPSGHSAKRTIELAFPGETVYARRKVGQRWLWRKQVVA